MEPTTLVAFLGSTALAALMALWAVLFRKGRTEDEARAYLAGFSYVLSDDADSAIAELSKAAQLNRQTVETYFALGALFRRKGELDRAIRLHCNILLRPGLNPDVRRRAQLELALDYQRSGLSDKASETFERLLAEEPAHLEGLVHYRQVLEETGQWEKAVELQLRLVKIEKKGEEVLAHLLSEMARTLLSDRASEAETLAAKATSLMPRCSNAQLALGQSLLAQGKQVEAQGPLCRAVELEPELAPRSVGLLLKAFQSSEQVEAFWSARSSRESEAADAFELGWALHLKAQGREDRALERLRRLVERRPHFWEARKELGALLLMQNRADELRAEYEEILRTLGKPTTGFICQKCRQKLPELVFRCPSCAEWDSVRREAFPN